MESRARCRFSDVIDLDKIVGLCRVPDLGFVDKDIISLYCICDAKQ